MVRSFPRSSRALTAALLGLSAALGLAAAPLAAAEEGTAPGTETVGPNKQAALDRKAELEKKNDEALKAEKKRVARNLDGAHDDLVESSAASQAAAAELERAQVELGKAQDHLAETQGELAAAQALDKQMQAKLEVAVLRLRRARAELAAGHRQIAEQEHELGQIVVSNYQTGDPGLMGLSMMLTSQDPAALTGQLNSVQNVIDKEAVTLSRLEATRVVLAVKEEEVTAARADVARQREAAAENLERKQGLEQQAQSAELQVRNLVSLREEARAKAEEARRADLATLQSLEAEQERIAVILKERAEEARAAAAAAAAAAANASAAATNLVSGSGVLTRPVPGAVTSPFGMRTHPIYGYRALHDGVDFGDACGTPILAAASGVVLEEYYQTAWGNRIIIDHGLRRGVGLATISNHLSGYAVAAGDKVRKGQVVGYVGTTGWSTGCHLHFTVMKNGVPVNPMRWL